MRRHNSLKKTSGPLQQYDDPMRRVDPFQQYPDVFKQIIDWSKDPMVRPENQNKYFFSDGKTYYEQICKMLKLMSVFKEAFQQIYDNEDEIHEAWNNFVDNLTATAEYGEEVGVTLTWTDESVNFDFTIPGGADGTGIQSIVFNADYTMTITLTDGTTYTSPSLRGETGATGATGPQGPAGPQGPQGDGLHILDVYPTLADLQQAHPTGSPGDAYEVGSDPTYTLYIWSSSQNAWVPGGSLGSVSPSNTNPLMDGTASPGISEYYSRGDHVHPTDTSRASQSDLNTVSGNLSTLSGQVSDIADAVDIVEDMVDDLSDIVQVSQNLPDQQFLYRESLADHDTIGRLDSIKGNTIVFNQLVQNGNFATADNWTCVSSVNLNISNSEATITTSSTDGIVQLFNSIAGHKYYLSLYAKEITNLRDLRFVFRRSNAGYYTIKLNSLNEYEKQQAIITCLQSESLFEIYPNVAYSDYQFSIKNIMICDLTQMGLDSLSLAEVEQWFSDYYPLSYYSYTTGKLLPFKGESLKITGKNLLHNTSSSKEQSGVTWTVNSDGTITVSGTPSANSYLYIDGYFPKGDYILSGLSKSDIQNLIWANVELLKNGSTVHAITIDSASDFTFSTKEYDYDQVRVTPKRASNNVACSGTIEPMIRLASVSDANFEPYTENTLSLSINDHFPTGIKSARSAYDEKTENMAITRIGSADLGSLSWNVYSLGNSCTYYAVISSKKTGNNVLCSNYVITDSSAENMEDKTAKGRNNDNVIFVRDTSYTSASAFKQAMTDQNVKLYFELATPIEQSISPVQDMTFKAWKGSTEQILPENTSDPYTAPIRTDMTYMSTDEAVLYLKDHAVTDPTVIDDIEDLQDDVSDLQTDVGNLQTDTGNLQTDVSGLQTSVSGLQTNVSGLQTSVSGLQTNVSGLQTNVSGLQTDVGAIETSLTDYCIVNRQIRTQSGSFRPGSTLDTGMLVNTIQGYKPIGVVGHRFYRLISGTPYNAEGMVMQNLFYSNQYVSLVCHNYGQNAVEDLYIEVFILYIRDNGGN